MTEAARGHWAAAAARCATPSDRAPRVSDSDILANLGNAALQLGDDQAAHRYYTAVLSGARESGAGMLVLYGLPRLAFPQLLTGQWTASASSADEALALGVSTGKRPLSAAPLAWLTLLAALQGKPEYDALLAGLEDVAATCHLGILACPVRDLTRWAKGTRAAHDVDTRAAFHHFEQMQLRTIRRITLVSRSPAPPAESGETRRSC